MIGRRTGSDLTLGAAQTVVNGRKVPVPAGWNAVTSQVPMIVPSAVPVPCVPSIESACLVAPTVCLANPKSSSLVPVAVSMMFPGLRSRWTIPGRCAVSRASAISMPKRSTCASGNGPRSIRAANVSPSSSSRTRDYLNIHRRGLHMAMQQFEESRRLANSSQDLTEQQPQPASEAEPAQKRARLLRLTGWCGREGSNLHGLAATSS